MNIWTSLLFLAFQALAGANIVSIFPEQCSQHFYDNSNEIKVVLSESILVEENHGTFGISLWIKIIDFSKLGTIFWIESIKNDFILMWNIQISSLHSLSLSLPYQMQASHSFTLSIVSFSQAPSYNWLFIAISANFHNKSLIFYYNNAGTESHISDLLSLGISLNFESSIAFGNSGSFKGAISDFKIHNNIYNQVSDWNTQYSAACISETCSSLSPSISYGKCNQLCASQAELFLPAFQPALYADVPYSALNDWIYTDIKSTIDIPDGEWSDYSVTGWAQFTECHVEVGTFFSLRHEWDDILFSLKLTNSIASTNCDKLEATVWSTDGTNKSNHTTSVIGPAYGSWFFFAVTLNSGSKLFTLYSQNGANLPSVGFPLISSSITYTYTAIKFSYKKSPALRRECLEIHKGNYADFRIYPGSYIDGILMQYNSNLYSPATYLDPHCVSWSSIWYCQACESGYFVKNGICQKCHPSCTSCSSDDTETNCLACAIGYYAQPGHPSMCFNYCPLGYKWNSSLCQCTGTKVAIASFNFDNNLLGNFTSSNIYIELGTQPDLYYPNFDLVDPLPANKRGLYFDSRLIWIHPQSSIQSGRIFGSDFTLEAWMMIKSPGSFFSSRRTYNDSYGLSQCDRVLNIGTNSSDILFLDTKSYGKEATVHSAQWSDSEKSPEWAFYSISLKFSDTSQSTEILLVNNIYSYIITMSGYYKEFPVMRHILGYGGYPPSAVGFVYSFAMYNYGKTYSEIILSLGTCSSCEACPKALNYCLPTCDETEYVDENGNCQKCLSSCKWICSRADTCNLCYDDLCYKCTKYEIETCVQCVENADLNNGQCECKSGYLRQGSQCVDECSSGFYFDENTQLCLSCPNNCAKCSDSESCSICKTEFTLQNGNCECSDGYFLGSSNKCLKCDNSCLTCSIYPSNCVSCISDLPILYENKCYPCDSFEGYSELFSVPLSYLTNDLLSQLLANCIEICGDEKNMGQSQCDDGNNNNGDGCSSNCTTETGWTCSGGSINSPDMCKDETPPSPILAYLSENDSGYLLALSFSEKVNMTSDLSENIEIQTDGIKMFSWAFSSMKSIYIIELNIYENVASGASATIIFIDPSAIADISGNKMEEKWVKTNLLAPFTYKTAGIMQAFVTSAVTATAAGVVVSSAVLGSFNLQALWGMVEMMQIQNYLIFLSLKYPNNLILYLRALSIANGNFLPNPFQQYIIKNDPFSDPPQKFIDENFNTDFLMNAGQFIFFWGITLIGLPVCLALFKSWPRIRIIRWLRNSYLFAILLRAGIESFLEITLSVFLQLRECSEPSQDIGYLSLILCFITMIYLSLTFTLIIRQVALKPKEKLESKLHERLFGVLYGGFRKKSRLAASFLLFQNFRRALIVFCCVFLYEYTIIQASFSVILSFIYTILLILIRPYEKKYLGNCLNIVCEILHFVSNCLILKFLDDQLSDDFRTNLGWSIIALLGTSLLLHIVCLLIAQIASLVQGVKKLKESFMKNFANKFVRARRRIDLNSKNSYKLYKEASIELKSQRISEGEAEKTKIDSNFSNIDTLGDEPNIG